MTGSAFGEAVAYPVALLSGINPGPPKQDRLRSVIAGYRDRSEGRGSGPPPIEVYTGRGGPPVLADGRHRLTAARMLGLETIDVIFRLNPQVRANAKPARMRSGSIAKKLPERPPERKGGRLRYRPGGQVRELSPRAGGYSGEPLTTTRA